MNDCKITTFLVCCVLSEILSSQLTASQRSSALSCPDRIRMVKLIDYGRVAGERRTYEESLKTDGYIPPSDLEMQRPVNNGDCQQRFLDCRSYQVLNRSDEQDFKDRLGEVAADHVEKEKIQQELEDSKDSMDEFFGPQGEGPATKLVIGRFTNLRGESPATAQEEAEQRAFIKHIQQRAQQARTRMNQAPLKDQQLEFLELTYQYQQAIQEHADYRRRMSEDQAWNDSKRWDELGCLANKVRQTEAALFNAQKKANQSIVIPSVRVVSET